MCQRRRECRRWERRRWARGVLTAALAPPPRPRRRSTQTQKSPTLTTAVQPMATMNAASWFGVSTAAHTSTFWAGGGGGGGALCCCLEAAAVRESVAGARATSAANASPCTHARIPPPTPTHPPTHPPAARRGRAARTPGRCRPPATPPIAGRRGRRACTQTRRRWRPQTARRPPRYFRPHWREIGASQSLELLGIPGILLGSS